MSSAKFIRQVDLPDEYDDEIENTQEQMQEAGSACDYLFSLGTVTPRSELTCYNRFSYSSFARLGFPQRELGLYVCNTISLPQISNE